MIDDLFKRFPLAAATGIMVLAMAACAIQLPHDDDLPPPPPPTTDNADTFAPKLERCLTVTPDQTATFEYCRRIWAENRRRFLGPKKKSSPAPPDPETPNDQSSPPVIAPKDQSRLPQGNPAVAAPESK
jgi:conjugative transfer region protein TrbK